MSFQNVREWCYVARYKMVVVRISRDSLVVDRENQDNQVNKMDKANKNDELKAKEN